VQNGFDPEVSSHLILFLSFYRFALLDFGEIPNEGVGRVTRQGNQKQLREGLLAARVARHRQSSPGSQVQPLPHLISAKDLNELRHDVPPVRLPADLLVSLLISIFLF
jgi:hypothetical protein